MTPDPIRILIADDSKLVRDALSDLLSDHPRLQVVATAADADEAIASAGAHCPDVVIVDYSMPGGGIHATQGIVAICPRAKIIALSAFSDEQRADEMLAAGAVRYVVKGVAGLDLVGNILEVSDDPASPSV